MREETGAETRARARPRSFGMYKEICVKACLRKDDTSGLGFLRPQSFSKKSTQVFVHEAPGHQAKGNYRFNEASVKHSEHLSVYMEGGQFP